MSPLSRSDELFYPVPMLQTYRS